MNDETQETKKIVERKADWRPVNTEPFSDLPECWYIEGLRCSAKHDACDKLQFSPACVMTGIKMIIQLQRASHDALRQDGMEKAVLWLQDHDYFKAKFDKYSASDIVDQIKEGMKAKTDGDGR